MRLTPDRERLDDQAILALITRAQAGDLAARNRVILAYWPLARWVVKQTHYGRGERRDDLLQACFLGLHTAVRRFDPACGPFAPWAIRHIRGACGRFRLSDRIVPVPPWWRETKHGPRAIQAASISLNAPLDTDSGQPHISLLAGNEPDPAVAAEEQDTRRALRDAVRALPARHRDVITARLAGHNVDDIARALDVSPQRIGQLQQHAIQRLRTALQAELG